MANALGTGTHKRKETYANEVLTLARAETNIYDDFSEDYEIDEVTGQINVPTRDEEVKVSDYDIKNGIELQTSGTDYLPLPVDKDYGVNELVDGYEAEAVPDNIKAQRLDSAGYSIGIKKESMAIACLLTGTEAPDKEATTVENVYKKIVREVKNMKKRNMKVSSMRVAITADIEEMLLTDEKFSNTAGTLGAELIREGIIGKIAGVPVKANYLLDNTEKGGDENVEFVVYDKRFCQKYEVWKKEPAFEDLKDGKHIGSSALQGRQVGGLTVTNKLGVQVKKKVSKVVDPEITSVTVTPEISLKAPITESQKVATISVVGGTQPYTYKLNGQSDNFKVVGTEVQASKQIDEAVNESVTVTVTDSKQKTKDGTAQINITKDQD